MKARGSVGVRQSGRASMSPVGAFAEGKHHMIPAQVFFVKGLGVHKHRLASFESALRNAGIEKFNLVYVSSIYPPNCKIVRKEPGLKRLKPGEIVHCVMSRNDTNEPNRLVSAAVGLAVPNRQDRYGYISEHHAFGVKGQIVADYTEDLAATMLATTLGIEFDPDQAWDERKQIYKASGQIIKTRNTCQSAEGHKDGLWTTVLAAAVFVCA
jgi:arginine decarboxylase